MRERTPRPEGKSPDGTVLDFRQHFAKKQQRQDDERVRGRQKELRVAMDMFDLHAQALLQTLARKGPASDRTAQIRVLLDTQIKHIEAMKLSEEEKTWCSWDTRMTLLKERVAEYEKPDQRPQRAS